MRIGTLFYTLFISFFKTVCKPGLVLDGLRISPKKPLSFTWQPLEAIPSRVAFMPAAVGFSQDWYAALRAKTRREPAVSTAALRSA